MKTIKIIGLFIFLISININSFAGDKFGIRAGYHASNLYNGSSALYNTHNTFYVGVFKDVKILPLLHFGAGIDYFQGGSIKDNDNDIILHYLSVPVDLKLKLGPFFALAGVAPSFKVHENWTAAGKEISPGSEMKSNAFDLPVFAGIGFKIAIISIEARYYYGTMSVNSNSLSGFDGYNSQYLQLGLAVSI